MRTTFVLSALVFTGAVSAQQFTPKPPLLEARYRAISFAVGGKVYCGTGRLADFSMDNAMRVYDPITETWEARGTFPGVPRRGATSMVINGVAYAGLGWDGTNSFNDWNRYDPVTDTWTPMAAVTANVGSYQGVFSLNGKGYTVGGSGVSGEDNETWMYDPATDSWAQKAQFPGAARDFPFADTAGGFAYVGLGDLFLTPPFFADAYRYDPVADAWTAIAPIPVTPSGAQPNGACGFHASYNGRIIVMDLLGETAGPDDSPFAYVYDPGTDSWTLYPDVYTPLPRETPVIAQVGSKVYFGGGSDFSNIDDQFWEIDLAALFTGIAEQGLHYADARVVAVDGGFDVSVPQEVLNSGASAMTVYTPEGRRLRTAALRSTATRVDASGLANGAYVYTLATGDRVWRSGRVCVMR